jgi:hypothetical protein
LLGSPTLDDCGEPRLGEKLRAMGYTHVVVRRDSPMGTWLLANPAPAGLARGPEFAAGRILEVTAERPRAYVSALLGFSPREYGAKATWRWMGQTGALRILATRESVGAVLGLDLKAFPRQRRVEWLLNGRRLGDLRARVRAGPRAAVLPLGPLPPGETTLLACSTPAVVANDVLQNGDLRASAWLSGAGGSTRRGGARHIS